MRALILALCALFLAACAGGDRSLRDLDSASDGPDEFSVTPSKPLELPADLSLPEPTPGAANRTDANPVGEAIAALGGSSAAQSSGADAGLVSFVSRNGVSPDIRAIVASEDAQLRNRASRFGLGIFRSGDRYFAAYSRQALDAYAELEKFRAAGVQTPSAPPE